MPVLRFHLLTITHEQVDGSVIVTVTTNAACHLYLRYSDVFPRIHRKSVLRRGLVMGWDARYCFTVYQHLEQNEESDTWTHTFTWPGWENCNTRYFYFWGTMGGQDMVSDTPIFWIHYLEVELPPFVYFYPDAHPEVTSVDGWLRRFASAPDYSWVNVHDGAGTGSRDDAGVLYVRIYSYDTAGKWQYIYRSILLFDTSAIPPGKTILAAELRLFCSLKSAGLTWPAWALAVVASTPLQNTTLTNVDYQALGADALSDTIKIGDFIAPGHNTLTLNPLGLTHIIPGGITKLGIREDTYDRANIQPPWARYKEEMVSIYSAERVDIEEKPRLGVAYI